MSDWDRFYEAGRVAEELGMLSTAEFHYEKALDCARTVGEERLAWRAYCRVGAEDSEFGGES